ncbi:MAG: hypothetical protein P8176_05565 [Gammaproteobacteria bacterium]
MKYEFTSIAQEIVQQGRAWIAETLVDTTDRALADGFLIMRHLPNRRILLHRHHQPGCPFCRERATAFLIERFYHGLLLSQNLGPYGPCSLILRSRTHHTQAETAHFIRTHGANLLLDLPHNMTLFCNQLAGNSEEHFHLQYLGQLLPIAKLSASPSPIYLDWQMHSTTGAQWAILDGSDSKQNHSAAPVQHFLGIVLRGDATPVAALAAEYLHRAEKLGMQRFNFSAWRDTDTNLNYIFITLRAPDTLRTRHPLFPILIGALAIGGLLTDGRQAEAVTDFDYHAFCSFMHTKTLSAEQHLSPLDSRPTLSSPTS